MVPGRFDKYTFVDPNPDKAEVVNVSIWFFKLSITGSSANSPFSVELSPLNVLVFKIVLRELIAVTKLSKLVVAEFVSTDEVKFAVELVVDTKFTV